MNNLKLAFAKLKHSNVYIENYKKTVTKAVKQLKVFKRKFVSFRIKLQGQLIYI